MADDAGGAGMDERNKVSAGTWPKGHVVMDPLEATTAPGAGAGLGSVEETVVRPGSLERAPTPADVERTTASLPAGGRAPEPVRELGRYLVVKQIGAGGMGAVYKAYDPDLDRKVAIKLLHGAGFGEARTRLLREAQAMAKLSHPNVVPVFDVGLHGEQVFIAMDLVEGTDLRAWISTRRPWTAVVDLFAQAGAGLAAAHARGLVHRDFKPDNVLLSADAATGELRAQVADFGLARRDEETGEATPGQVGDSQSSALDTQLTGFGAVVGTPAYMSPEQHAGVAVDARTDQFSFCVALFEALYGKRPFTGATLEELGRKASSSQREPPPRGSVVPGWLHRLCLRGLQPDREARYPRMDALLVELQAGRGRRHRRALAVGGALLAAAVAGGTALAMTGPAMCEGGAGRVGEVWQARRGAAIAGAFAATGLPYAADAWTGAAPLVDRYADDWKNMYNETCSATEVRGEQSAELMDLRMACLQHRLQDLDALLGLFEAADVPVVKRAAEAALALPELQACADAEALRSGAAGHKAVDPARSGALRERLRAARAHASAGHNKKALAEYEALDAQATALADPSLTAAVRLGLAGAQQNTGAHELAAKTGASAVWQAIADRDDASLWDALLAQIEVVGYQLGRKADAQPWIEHAQAVLRRRGAPDRARAELLYRVGMVEVAASDNASAEAPITEAIALYEEVYGPGHTRLSGVLGVLGAIKLRSGAYAEAQALFDQAIAILERSHGPGHPTLAMPLNNLALTYERQTRYEAAISTLQRSQALLAAINEDDPNIGVVRLNIGGMLQLSGKPDEALVELEAARQHLVATLGPEHMMVARVFTFAGDAQRDLKDYPAARAAYEQGRAIRDKAVGPDHADQAFSFLGKAQVDLLEGKPADALVHADRALLLIKDTSPDPSDLGLIEFARAEALHRTGRREAARVAAQAAREAFVRAGAVGERGLAALTAWEATLEAPG